MSTQMRLAVQHEININNILKNGWTDSEINVVRKQLLLHNKVGHLAPYVCIKYFAKQTCVSTNPEIGRPDVE